MTDNNEKWEPLGGYTRPIVKGADLQSSEWEGKPVSLEGTKRLPSALSGNFTAILGGEPVTYNWKYEGLMEGSSFKVQGLPGIVIPSPTPQVLLAHMVDGTSELVDYLRGCLHGMPDGGYVIEMEVPALKEYLGVCDDLLYVHVTKGMEES